MIRNKLAIILIFLAVADGYYVTLKKLKTFLLDDYDKDILPNGPDSKAFKVHFDMKIQTLVGYDMKKQVLTVTAFNMLNYSIKGKKIYEKTNRWTDPQLRWNTTEYNSTKRINIDRFGLLTSFSTTHIYKTKVNVLSDGTIIWNNPVTWKISCSSDVTWFPIDSQSCSFSFGSWSYSDKEIKLLFWSKPSSKENLYSGLFHVESGEWTIVSLESSEENLKFNCCIDPFSTITFYIVLTRLSLYYFIYIILPLGSLTFLFLIVFYIPYDSGERMGFGVTVLLSITVYLLVISEKLPEKSDTNPMLGICFIAVFYILCIALALAAVTTVLPRCKQKPPAFLTNLVNNGISFRRKTKVVATSQTKVKSTSPENNNFDTKNDEDDTKKDFQEEWVRICRYVDKRLSIFFLILLIALPVIIIFSLPTNGRK